MFKYGLRHQIQIEKRVQAHEAQTTDILLYKSIYITYFDGSILIKQLTNGKAAN